MGDKRQQQISKSLVNIYNQQLSRTVNTAGHVEVDHYAAKYWKFGSEIENVKEWSLIIDYSPCKRELSVAKAGMNDDICDSRRTSKEAR